MIPAQLAAVENAVHAWVVAATGLSADHVLWRDQGAPRPSGPWVSIGVLALVQAGEDWVDMVDAAEPAPGADIEHRARGARVLVLSLQAFSGAATGPLSSAALLERVRGAAALPGRIAALNAAGIGVGPMGPVNVVGGVLQTAHFEPRATLEVRLHLMAEAVELGTWIETVEVSGGGSEFVVSRPSDP